MRRCPDCAEQIQALARVCRFCGHRLEPSDGALTATAIIANEMNPPHVTAIALQGSGPLTAVAVESHPLPSDPPEVYLIDPDADEDTQLDYSGDEIRDISFSAADPERIVAVTWDGVVRVWEEPSGGPTLEISGESGHRLFRGSPRRLRHCRRSRPWWRRSGSQQFSFGCERVSVRLHLCAFWVHESG